VTTKRPGRTQKIAVDETPLNAPHPDIDARIGWLLAILVLGNIAMATYMLIQLFKLPANAKIEELILRRS